MISGSINNRNSYQSSTEEEDETKPFIKMNPLTIDMGKEEDYDTRNFIQKTKDFVLRKKKKFARRIYLNGNVEPTWQRFPANKIHNQKYNLITWVPLVLYEQFKYFFNLYYLIITLTQFIPILQVGFLFTYVAPLALVLAITVFKEGFDDLQRWRRDRMANSQKYEKVTASGRVTVASSSIKVGDLICIDKNQRVPADCVFLRTSEKTGACFLRTDQLDGETDWKLRRAVSVTQNLKEEVDILSLKETSVYAEAPKKEIYDFIGTMTNRDRSVLSLSLENALWANTVIANGNVVALVVYTGQETRSVMNQNSPRSKVGLLDSELNTMSKLLFIIMLILSFVMIALNQFRGLWLISLFRFLLLYSSIIPISMRVNLDFGKALYSFFIMRDKKIPGTIVRNSSIPEELGRISYLFTYGTLTQNDMIFKKLNCGSIAFSDDTLCDVAKYLRDSYDEKKHSEKSLAVRNVIYSFALCHNVTPTFEDGERGYQASSPDEVALVKFADSVGLILHARTLTSITLKTPVGQLEKFEILENFPFTSESKRMGIIVRNVKTKEIFFFVKGADVVMSKMIRGGEWLNEVCDKLARVGLRTLVFSLKKLTSDQYAQFSSEYNKAKASLRNRAEEVKKIRLKLEKKMNLLGVSGVEDKLQEDVKFTLENLRNAGIKIWMLTGDKVETATCIARSSKLIARSQIVFKLIGNTVEAVEDLLDEFGSKTNTCLVIDGKTLQICLDALRSKFLDYSGKAPCVVCCRCSPTQKAEIVKLMKKKTKKRVASIGDGGNDVAMILEADVGIGIVGKEGKQASLAADFSITQFSYCARLILWHGRNSYKRSARLSQFVIHRGLIISIIQAVFSAIYYFAAIPIYTGWLMVGYATYYTMIPVFAIVTDNDVTEDIVTKYPELYKDLQKGRSLNTKTFFIWLFKSTYQGGVIMLLALILFENSFLRIVSITFTALVLTELIMVQLEVQRTCNVWLIIANIGSVICYVVSIFLLPSYFEIGFILSFDFWWKTILITLASIAPVSIVKVIKRVFFPPNYTKL